MGYNWALFRNRGVKMTPCTPLTEQLVSVELHTLHTQIHHPSGCYHCDFQRAWQTHLLLILRLFQKPFAFIVLGYAISRRTEMKPKKKIRAARNTDGFIQERTISKFPPKSFFSPLSQKNINCTIMIFLWSVQPFWNRNNIWKNIVIWLILFEKN